MGAVRRRRTVVAGAMAGAFIVANAGGAQAAASWTWWKGYTYTRPPDAVVPAGCAYLSTRMGVDISGTMRPQLDTYASWHGQGAGGPCSNHSLIATPNTVAAREDLYVFNTYVYGPFWVLCNEGPWVYNSGTVATASTGYTWRTAPCGSGEYAVVAAGYIGPYGEWHGGWREAPSQWIQ